MLDLSHYSPCPSTNPCSSFLNSMQHSSKQAIHILLKSSGWSSSYICSTVNAELSTVNKLSIFFQAHWSFFACCPCQLKFSMYCSASVVYHHAFDQALLSQSMVSCPPLQREPCFVVPTQLPHLTAQIDLTHITTVIHQNPRTGTLYHNCSVIASLPHSLKQFSDLFKLQSYPCQAESATQASAQR